jgi:hypothetical protein
MKIAAASQRPTVCRPEEIAGTYSARGGHTGGLDVADEEACEWWQANRSALLECSRGGVDNEAELWREPVLRSRLLERVEKLAKQLAELAAFLLAQARELGLGICQVLWCTGLKELPTGPGERNQGTPAILRIDAPAHQTATDQLVQTDADGSWRETEFAREPSLGYLRVSQPNQGGDDREVSASDPEPLEDGLELGREGRVETGEAGGDRNRLDR